MTVSEPDELAPEVRDSRLVSLVWLVPLVAVLIGGWLVVQTWLARGPVIVIEVASAEGIEPEVTKVRLRNVEVGLVTDVRVSDDLSRVLVTARLVKEAERYLVEGTRFWVVSPRVGPGGVSGLSTLLSGAYIALDPGEGASERRFVALETPPPFAATEPGRRFVLTTPLLGNLSRGSGVFHRGLRIGEVVDYRLVPERAGLEVDIFVPEALADLVREDARFWLANGVTFTVSGSGVRVEMTSLEAFLVGGVEFVSPVGSGAAVAENGQRFPLFDSAQRAADAESVRTMRFVASFDGDVGGLPAGATVLFRGLRIGRVLDVRLAFEESDASITARVTFEVFGERLYYVDGTPVPATRDFLDGLVAEGLRAQLQATNLLTGELGIAFDLFPDASPAEIDWEAQPPVMPTVPSSREQLQATLQGTLAAIQALPLQEIGENLRQLVAGAADLVQRPALGQAVTDASGAAAALASLAARLEEELPAILAQVRATADGAEGTVAELQRALAAATEVLQSTETIVASVESVPYDTQRLLQELRVLTRSLTSFVDYLERDPAALLRGRR
jgi:paraquat-inducible protein B